MIREGFIYWLSNFKRRYLVVVDFETWSYDVFPDPPLPMVARDMPLWAMNLTRPIQELRSMISVKDRWQFTLDAIELFHRRENDGLPQGAD